MGDITLEMYDILILFKTLCLRLVNEKHIISGESNQGMHQVHISNNSSTLVLHEGERGPHEQLSRA